MATQIYKVGTVSVTAGSRNFVGSGTAWDLALINGGLLFVEGAIGGWPIEEITSDTTGIFELPWPGASLPDAPYRLFLETAQAANAIEANANLLEAARRLNAGTLLGFNASGTLAQRAAFNGEDQGFVYMRTDVSPFQFSVKRSATSGDWSAWTTFTGPAGEDGEPGQDGIGDAYDVHFGAAGRPGAAESFDTLIARAVTFPGSFSGSVARVSAAPDASAVFSIRKNGSQVGTITFAEGATTGTFAGAGAGFVSGDRLSIVAPDPRNDTLSGVLITLAGNR